jgi:hypothetical protein
MGNSVPSIRQETYMRLHHIAMLALIGSAAAFGCKHASSVDQSAVNQIRQNYQAADPNAKVGVVIAVLPESGLIAVGDIRVADLKVNDTLVLLTPKQKIIGAGKVVALTADAAHVTYDVTANGRAPQIGDVAVKAQ